MASQKKYDLFLSFRGEDTRNNFMSHLKAQLQDNGIKIFTDNERVKVGESIAPQLLQAIEDSRCAIIIFSPQYASSTWCLDELVKIFDCMKRMGQIVVPIFYHVDPSDVRDQTGIFGEAFAKHEGDYRLQSWRNALTKVAADLPGFELQNRNEAEFISDIVETVSERMNTVASSNNSEGVMNSVAGSHFPRLEGIRNNLLLLFSFFFFPLYTSFAPSSSDIDQLKDSNWTPYLVLVKEEEWWKEESGATHHHPHGDTSQTTIYFLIFPFPLSYLLSLCCC